MQNRDLFRQTTCAMTKKELDTLPGFGAARILNRLAGEIVLNVARYGKNKIAVFIFHDGKNENWQQYFIQLVDT
jgi:hypothetical protein